MYEAIHVHTLTFLHVFNVRREDYCPKFVSLRMRGGGGGESDILSYDNITCRLQPLYIYTANLERTLQPSSRISTLLQLCNWGYCHAGLQSSKVNTTSTCSYG